MMQYQLLSKHSIKNILLNTRCRTLLFLASFISLILITNVTHAAISFDNSSNAVVTNNNTLSWRHNIGIGTNRKLIVGIGIEENDGTSDEVVTSVTYNGVNLTFAGQTNVSSTSIVQRVEVWYMDEANMPNGNRWIQVNTTGNVREISSGAISLFDAEQGAPAFQASSSNISQTSISTNITTTVDNTWVVDVVGSGQPFTFAPGAGQSERWDSDQSIGNWTSSAASSTKVVTTAGVTTMTQNQNSNRMAHVVLAIKPFGVAPPVLPATVAEWRMDELSWDGTAGEVIDSSVNGLNGVGVGSATPTAAKLCNGATLNGSTDYIEISDNALLDISNELSVTAWFKTDAIPGSGLKTIVSKDENYEFHLTNTGEINWWWNNSADTVRSITTSGANITAGTWYHVAIVYSQASSSQKIYINGIELASSTYNEALKLNNDPLQIGSDQGVASRLFDGQIDEVHIYASMLTAGNVSQVMIETRTCPGVTTPIPIVLSTAGTATLLGTTFQNEDAVALTAAAATIIFDGSTIFAGNEDIDAFHFINSDNVLLSTTGNALIGATSFRDEDVVQYTYSTGNATIIFDGSTIFSGNEDVDAIYQIDTDTILISTMDNASIGGNNYQDNDMIQYTLSTGVNSVFFDLENYTAGGSDIDGFHILPNGNYLISTDDSETVGALSFEDEDVIELDIVTPSATLYFDGDANYSADEETDAVTLVVPTIALDHFAINYLTGASGTGVNCQAEAITIEAHDASHNLITIYTGMVTLSSSTANGDWSKTGTAADAFGTLTAGTSDSGSATYTFEAIDSGSVIINFKDTHVEIVNLNTIDGLISETTNAAVANDDYLIDFAATGFNFLASGIKNTIATQISGKASTEAPGIQSFELLAIKTSGETGACEAAFTGATAIEIAIECVDPASCTGDNLYISTDSGTTFDQMDGTPELTYTSITDFDFGIATDTTAPFIIRYDDAGKIKLHARKILTPSTEQMVGASNEFVVRPFGFSIDFSGLRAADYVDNGILDDSTGTNLSYAADPTGSVFTKAGLGFITNLASVAWQAADDTNDDGIADTSANLTNNSTTQNFGNEITAVIPANVIAVPTVTLVPNTGTISNSANSATFTNGAGTKTLTWSEVGIVNLTTTLTNYLASGSNIIGNAQNVGRFVPDHFDTTLTPGCNTFTYSGQPSSVIAYAKNNGGGTTLNYQNTYAFNTTVSNSGDTTNFTNNSILASNFVNGIGTRVDVTYTFPAKDTVPATVILRARDADTPTATGTTEATNVIRSGRARLENVYGPELTPLTMPLKIQYFSDNATVADLTDDGFVLNTNDTCTNYDATAGALTNYTGNLSGGETTVTGAVAESNGLSNITFSAPGASNEGSVNLLANNISSWLTYNWNVDCDNADGDNDLTTGIDAGMCGPFGTASFGLYRGDDRIIYWREVF